MHHALARHRDDAAAMARQRGAIIVRQRVERVVLVQERADAGEDFLALRARALLALLLLGELALALLPRVALRLSLGGRRRRRRRRVTHAPGPVAVSRPNDLAVASPRRVPTRLGAVTCSRLGLATVTARWRSDARSGRRRGPSRAPEMRRSLARLPAGGIGRVTTDRRRGCRASARRGRGRRGRIRVRRRVSPVASSRPTASTRRRVHHRRMHRRRTHRRRMRRRERSAARAPPRPAREVRQS